VLGFVAGDPKWRYGTRRKLQALRALAGLSCLAVLLSTCSWGAPRDPLADRCLQVLRWQEPSLRDVGLADARVDPDRRAVTLSYETGRLAGSARGQIRCGYEARDGWRLESIRVGGEDLSEAAVALVNAELLLRDLSQNPQRFGS
jgi:hypothetical protein